MITKVFPSTFARIKTVNTAARPMYAVKDIVRLAYLKRTDSNNNVKYGKFPAKMDHSYNHTLDKNICGRAVETVAVVWV